MSKVVVFGAGGRAGRQAVAEARRRGHHVTAVVRDSAKYADLAAEGVDVVEGDITDAAAVASLVTGHDAVIAAAAAYGPGIDSRAFFVGAAQALTGGLTAAGVRRLVVVGLSSLLPDGSGTALMDGPGFPAEFRPFCLAHGEGLAVLQSGAAGLDWLYASPAGDFDHSGTRTGTYGIGDHGDGLNRISYADFAIALLDEIDAPQHHHTHLAVTG
ncbi:NAD(P)-dependent oxidoreductase [Streptomyces cinnamoneus]|uniref:NAD(P)-dependent oxidoreductase n=1 Tax=Streptomyces cinnamoneus TaxID=53446 RepID=UPI0037903FB4